MLPRSCPGTVSDLMVTTEYLAGFSFSRDMAARPAAPAAVDAVEVVRVVDMVGAVGAGSDWVRGGKVQRPRVKLVADIVEKW